MTKSLRQIAEQTRSGTLDPQNVIDQCRQNAEKFRDLNIYTAMAEDPKGQKQGKLAGTCFIAKDAVETKDIKTCGASPALNGLDIKADATIIRILTAAGATLNGKANMHELSFGVTSNNKAYGPVRNPYDRERSAGGSSGGSAAAIACGTANFAIAADTGGSSRIPAAHCGKYGFRPTTGRWPDEGLLKVSPTRDSLGAITQSADDLLLVDEVITGDESIQMPDPDKLRLGLLAKPYMEDIDPSVAKVIRSYLDSLERLGIEIIECDGSQLHDLEDQSGFPIALYEARIELIKLAGRMNVSFEDFASSIASPDVKGIVSSLAGEPDETGYRRAMDEIRPALITAYNQLFSRKIDALILPTTPLAAPLIGADEEVELLGRSVPTFSIYARNTAPASVAGMPSVTVPAGKTEEGLPVGILFEAAAGNDRQLLSIIASIEKARA